MWFRIGRKRMHLLYSMHLSEYRFKWLGGGGSKTLAPHVHIILDCYLCQLVFTKHGIPHMKPVRLRLCVYIHLSAEQPSCLPTWWKNLCPLPMDAYTKPLEVGVYVRFIPENVPLKVCRTSQRGLFCLIEVTGKQQKNAYYFCVIVILWNDCHCYTHHT